jgi:hypothetical protein
VREFRALTALGRTSPFQGDGRKVWNRRKAPIIPVAVRVQLAAKPVVARFLRGSRSRAHEPWASDLPYLPFRLHRWGARCGPLCERMVNYVSALRFRAMLMPEIVADPPSLSYCHLFLT